MGKKRRYIHRAKKFATKAFHFLDGIDGTEDGIITDSAGYIEDIIESITLTKDRGMICPRVPEAAMVPAANSML